MNPQLSTRILIVLSIAFGITVAILGVTESSALDTVALIGALVIGGLWAVRPFVSGSGKK